MLFACLFNRVNNLCEKMHCFGVYVRTNDMLDYERTFSLVNTMDNSMSLIAIILESLCHQQRKSIFLNFWVGKKCNTNKIGDLMGQCHSLHVINTSTALLFYAGKEHIHRVKRACWKWTIEEEIALMLLLKEKMHLTVKDLAHYFFNTVWMCHTTYAIRAKLHSLQSKDNNISKQTQTSAQLFLKAIEDTPTDMC